MSVKAALTDTVSFKEDEKFSEGSIAIVDSFVLHFITKLFVNLKTF